ncbi:bifunctional protein [includes: biotin operon repressor; biotin-[acetyl-CoA-carboxylase]synthetase] [Escherichia coli]|nr:bifunctional protein [includes: biotin operon repressor; biotin-[acetyl-CoA-carboxylase]synthetase] [Escherichia coli]
MKDNTVPLKLIALLANGEFHSGEQLGETLGMSRAAINKHIQTLRDWALMSLPFRVKDTACLSLSSYLMLNRYWVSWMAVV